MRRRLGSRKLVGYRTRIIHRLDYCSMRSRPFQGHTISRAVRRSWAGAEDGVHAGIAAINMGGGSSDTGPAGRGTALPGSPLWWVPKILWTSMGSGFHDADICRDTPPQHHASGLFY